MTLMTAGQLQRGDSLPDYSATPVRSAEPFHAPGCDGNCFLACTKMPRMQVYFEDDESIWIFWMYAELEVHRPEKTSAEVPALPPELPANDESHSGDRWLLMLRETAVVEFTCTRTLHNVCLGYDPAAGLLVCVPEIPVAAGQCAKVHEGTARLLVTRHVAKWHGEAAENPLEPVAPAPRPPAAQRRKLPRPKPAMDQSRIGRRGATAPGTCGRDVWNKLAGRYEPCACKRHHRDQCRSQAQIDARTAQQRERRKRAKE
jgi:hypothetical protein